MNQNCKVCGEVAAGYHFGAFTCEGCKSFFGRTYNNRSSIGECKNNDQCIINKKNRTSCKSCRLKKCFSVGMSKSGSRYGRRSNWFKIHCLLQDQGIMQQQHQQQQQQQQQQQHLHQQQQDQQQTTLLQHQQLALCGDQQDAAVSLNAENALINLTTNATANGATNLHHLHRNQHLLHASANNQNSNNAISQLTSGLDISTLNSLANNALISPPTNHHRLQQQQQQQQQQNQSQQQLQQQQQQVANIAAALGLQNNMSPDHIDPTQMSSQLYTNTLTQFLLYNLLLSQRPPAAQ